MAKLRIQDPVVWKGFRMLLWMIGGLSILTLLAWKVLRDARADDKLRPKKSARY